MKIELSVALLIPDTTAITTFNTLNKMGYALKELQRMDYYSFEIDGDEKSFVDKIKKTDVLVNANKHKAFINEKHEGVNLLVKSSDDDCADLLGVLRERLGLSEIKSMSKGTLWIFEDEKLAKKAADELLCNPHYEEYALL